MLHSVFLDKDGNEVLDFMPEGGSQVIVTRPDGTKAPKTLTTVKSRGRAPRGWEPRVSATGSTVYVLTDPKAYKESLNGIAAQKQQTFYLRIDEKTGDIVTSEPIGRGRGRDPNVWKQQPDGNRVCLVDGPAFLAAVELETKAQTDYANRVAVTPKPKPVLQPLDASLDFLLTETPSAEPTAETPTENISL